MNIKDIVLQNMVIQAKHGLDMTEGTNITLKNVNLITAQTNPVLYVHNSKNITLDGIKYRQAELLLNVSGEKSSNIKLNNTDASKAKEKIKFEFGASEKALGDKAGINRYGFLLPMDDSLAQVAIDFGGRSWLIWDATFSREKIGDMPTEMFYHFFKSFSDAAKCNLNIKVEGDNEHHKIESIFKTLATSIKIAVKRDVENMQLPTTKGIL